MSRTPLKYLLFNDLKRPLYVDGDGHIQEGFSGTYLTPSGELACLGDDPQGWVEALVKYARNNRYHGVFRSYTQALRFVGDGAKILRSRMWTLGYEGVVYMGILRLDLHALPYQYKAEYVSELNLVKYSEGDTQVAVEALEGGLSKYLKAFETTTFDIPLDADAQSVKLDGTIIKQQLNYLVPEVTIASPSPRNFMLPVSLMGADSVNGTDVLYSTQTFEALPDGTDVQSWLGESPNWWFKTEAARTIKVQGTVKTRQGSDITTVSLYGTTGKVFYYQHTLQGEGERTFTLDLTLALPAGETLYLFLTHAFTREITLLEADLTIAFDYRFRPTYALGFYLMDALEKLVRRMSDGRYGARSSWLATKKDVLITSGDAVRGLDNPVLKLSLSDLFRILSFWSVGLGIENDTLVVEPLAYFYPRTVALDLGEVSAAKIDVAEDRLFNTIQVGSEEEELDEANGRYAFCQPQEWKTPATRVPRSLDLTCPALTDPFALEHLRITTFGKTTTGDSGDNRPVLLHVVPPAAFVSAAEAADLWILGQGFFFSSTARLQDFAPGMRFSLSGTTLNNGTFTVTGVVRYGSGFIVGVAEEVHNEAFTQGRFETRLHGLYRDPSAVVAGVPDPTTVFNVLFRPTNALLNNGPLIRSVLDKMDTGALTLSSAKRNTELTTTAGGVTRSEKAPVQIGGLGAKLFLPYLLKFRASASASALQLLKANPYGRLRFRWNNQQWEGFLTDGGVRLADMAEQEWSLLSAPENDLSKFNQVS